MKELSKLELLKINGGDNIFVRIGRWIYEQTCECNQSPNSSQRWADFNSTRGRL